MIDDLIAFLHARLDEGEAAARVATPGPWRHDPRKHHHIVGTALFEEAVFTGPSGDDAICVAGTGETDDAQSMRDAAHIARHDPPRVLAEIEAKRAIIDEALSIWNSDADGIFGFGESILRHLALPYADHPGYKEAWRP
ncbi:DUF6221 family protein [Streptomyces decoyicus]|uniref:DUF6221 family protein n=1 Tax=Streptomyces decoyicus TaxID=249567 RepID=UPI0033BA76C0